MTLTKDNYFFRTNGWWFYYDKTTTYNESGELHSYNDKPALVFRNSKGRVYREEWYYNGLPHREGDKPAVAVWYCDTVKISLHTLEWHTHGKLHRGKCSITGEQYPATLSHTRYGKVFLTEYYIDGKLHRENNYAYMYITPNRTEYKHLIDGLVHNLNGPAKYCKLRDIMTEDINYYIFGRAYNYKKYIKQKFIYNVIINRIRKLRRKILNKTLKTTTVNIVNGPDICNLISTYVY